ncbi:MAG: helix-turn-helix domain-containing protein, partial [Woeseiaceae bacterium]
MSKPRYRRRKEDRPKEITDAAFHEFAAKGYAATRVEEVANRAGVSKGLLYLYFKTKEELFKAVIRSVVMRRVDALVASVETTELSSEAFLRGPMLEFMKQVPNSPVAVVIRLL